MLIELLKYAFGYELAVSLIPLIFLVILRKRAGESLGFGFVQWAAVWAATWVAMGITLTVVLAAWATLAAGGSTVPGWILTMAVPCVIGYGVAKYLLSRFEDGWHLPRFTTR